MADTHPKVILVQAVDNLLRRLQQSNPSMTVAAIRTLIHLKTHPGGDPYWDPETAFGEDQPRPPSVSELAQAVRVPQPTMTRIVKMLSEGDDRIGSGDPLGLVRSERDPKEHRLKVTYLTQKGSEMIEEAFDIAEETILSKGEKWKV